MFTDVHSLAADGSQATKKRAKSGKQRPKTTKKSNRTPGNTRRYDDFAANAVGLTYHTPLCRKPQHQQEIEVNQATGSQPSWTMISSARLICSCGIKVSKAVELHDTNRSYWMILSHCPGCGSKTPIDNLSL